MRKIPALTLVEVLLLLSVLAVLVSGGMSVLVGVRLNQAMVASAEKFATVIRQAHIFAREEKDDRAWGVRYEGVNSYSLIAFVETVEVRAGYKLGSPSVFEDNFGLIIFAQGTGALTDKREIKIRSSNGRAVRVNILETGVVEAQR